MTITNQKKIGTFIAAVAVLSLGACNDNSKTADTTSASSEPSLAGSDTVTPPPADSSMTGAPASAGTDTMSPPPVSTDPSTNSNKDPATGSATQ